MAFCLSSLSTSLIFFFPSSLLFSFLSSCPLHALLPSLPPFLSPLSFSECDVRRFYEVGESDFSFVDVSPSHSSTTSNRPRRQYSQSSQVEQPEFFLINHESADLSIKRPTNKVECSLVLRRPSPASSTTHPASRRLRYGSPRFLSLAV